jgi:hypothetical protein
MKSTHRNPNRVAFTISCDFPIGMAGLNRLSPTGARAYGIPLNASTVCGADGSRNTAPTIIPWPIKTLGASSSQVLVAVRSNVVAGHCRASGRAKGNQPAALVARTWTGTTSKIACCSGAMSVLGKPPVIASYPQPESTKKRIPKEIEVDSR